jgi:nucleoside 2-deoxyribosyltransferase
VKIYVAGSSKEHLIVATYIQKLKGVGHIITHDWTEAVRAHGPANDEKLSVETQKYYARCDLNGIKDADYVWFICPELDTKGMWTELGYAIAIAQVLTKFRKIALLASGNTKQCIFLAEVDRQFKTHDEAFRSLENIGTQFGSW